ncbi:hypothetical protein CPB86DRAFT_704508, partial [Serendipita vermifera]
MDKKWEQKAKARQEEKEALKRSRQESQRRRSAVFTHARLNEAQEVKAGIYEEEIDSTGGECLRDMDRDEVFLGQHHGGQIDLKETLLHIFARNGNLSMVQWLCEHNADAEERDSCDRSAFHISIQNGHIPIFMFFLGRYPPSEPDSTAVLSPPKTPAESNGSYSLLRLAMDSLSLTMVQAIIKEKLYDQTDLEEAW